LGISVTDETLERATRVKRLIGRPQEALLCAKAKRQRQSAQPERKSPPFCRGAPLFLLRNEEKTCERRRFFSQVALYRCLENSFFLFL